MCVCTCSYVFVRSDRKNKERAASGLVAKVFASDRSLVKASARLYSSSMNRNPFMIHHIFLLKTRDNTHRSVVDILLLHSQLVLQFRSFILR